MTTNNDLKRIKTPLLASMIDSYFADFGRILTRDEIIEKEKTLKFLQMEMDARGKLDAESNLLRKD